MLSTDFKTVPVFITNVVDGLIRRLLKMRLLKKNLVKHIAVEENLVPFGQREVFLKKLLLEERI